MWNLEPGPKCKSFWLEEHCAGIIPKSILTFCPDPRGAVLINCCTLDAVSMHYAVMHQEAACPGTNLKTSTVVLLWKQRRAGNMSRQDGRSYLNSLELFGRKCENVHDPCAARMKGMWNSYEVGVSWWTKHDDPLLLSSLCPSWTPTVGNNAHQGEKQFYRQEHGRNLEIVVLYGNVEGLPFAELDSDLEGSSARYHHWMCVLSPKALPLPPAALAHSRAMEMRSTNH